MSLTTWANARVQRCQWFDISFVKLSTAAFILMVAKLWQPILSLEWYWYLIIAVIAAIRPTSVVFGKGK